MDKQTESREQFEAAAANKLNFSISTVIASRSGESYDSEILSIWWHFWQASRESLVVALPQKISEFNRMSHNGVVTLEAVNYDEAIDDCADALRAIGIRIKGE
ncbi:hypothetical protein HZI31_06435 [Serratia fonticola]|uniref:hypothetical protein n=1 Tax=Serratia fonticola TaxID=47917 RepID=UPI0015C5BFD7|nr:hypothetical protein [Serratia fonticola]NYA42943.1 hypothetical protein [Serratia fonticola]